MSNRIIFAAAFALAAIAGSAAHADKAERTWQAKCSACHGDAGKGDTAKGKEMGIADMSSAAWQKALTDGQIQKAIEDGVTRDKDGKKQTMEGYKSRLPADQIADLVKYVRTLAK